MYGQRKKYEASLANTPGPVAFEDIPDIEIDIKGLLAYAKEKGVEPGYLSEEEKEHFIVRNIGKR